MMRPNFSAVHNGYIALHEVDPPELSADMLRQDILSVKLPAPASMGGHILISRS